MKETAPGSAISPDTSQLPLPSTTESADLSPPAGGLDNVSVNLPQ